MTTISAAATAILADSGIDEAQVQSMLDLAGEFLASRDLAIQADHQVEIHRYDGTISISMPIATSPRDTAALEWDFFNQLFTVMPDCPAATVHIGFVSSAECPVPSPAINPVPR